MKVTSSLQYGMHSTYALWLCKEENGSHSIGVDGLPGSIARLARSKEITHNPKATYHIKRGRPNMTQNDGRYGSWVH